MDTKWYSLQFSSIQDVSYLCGILKVSFIPGACEFKSTIVKMASSHSPFHFSWGMLRNSLVSALTVFSGNI